MKFDLHCHTKEGSIDSKVPVAEYARQFKKLGFDGFMITDHNSYKGCKEWDRIKYHPEFTNIVGLCGIEYDTKDAGHILVVMPDEMYLPILKIRGMKCKKLIKIVHLLGGILGPAHPFGVASSSAMGFKKMDPALLKKMDFIEAFNTCEFPESNKKAVLLANHLNLPVFAGSDSHVPDYIGMACTNIPADIRCNNDLIKAVKSGVHMTALGTEREITKKAKRKEHWVGRLGFRIYNHGLGALIYPYRKYHHRKLLHRKFHLNA